jgi:hypothetical protein
MEELKDTIEMTGIYKPKTKFIEFIGAKGNVNFLAQSATINVKQLSGMYYEDITLKLTIYDDGTIGMDELDTNHTTQEERIRLIQIIEDKTFSTFRNRSVINELMFTSIEKVKDKTIPLYLAVEYTTPIEKLSSLFDDRLLVPNEISDDAMDNLNDLLNSWFEDEEFAKEVEEMINEENSQPEGFVNDEFMQDHVTVPTSNINDSFSKMKEEKLLELKRKRDKTEMEINKQTFQLSNTQKQLTELESELKLLEDRIENLQPSLENNGLYFSVSERQNEQINLDPKTEELIRKTVTKVKSINADAFMSLFKDGEFHICIATKNDTEFEKVTDIEKIDKDVLENLSKLDLSFEDGKFIYHGEFTWGDIVNKMCKFGFQQDHEFDLICFPKSETVENDKTSKF